MCLLIFAHRTSPQYPLVVAANRDEFHARATAPADFWQDHPQLLAGIDLEQGGTWMGVTRGGRFAAVTNYRDPSRTATAPRSRGELPLHYLTGQQGPQDFLASLSPIAAEYAGFNLLVGDRDTLWYYSNSSGDTESEPQCLPPGVYALSNARLDTPWPKAESGKAKLQQLLATGHPSHEKLSTVVADRRPANADTLQLHGLDSAMDQLLSAQFIITEAYGTRSCTTAWIDGNQMLHWQEQSFDQQGALREVRTEEFEIV
jgi:uncharacterized protein with NRDE domain